MFESQLPLSTCWKFSGPALSLRLLRMVSWLQSRPAQCHSTSGSITQEHFNQPGQSKPELNAAAFVLIWLISLSLTHGGTINCWRKSCGLFGLFMHVTSENVLFLPPNYFFIFGISPFTVQRLNHISVGRYCPMTDKPVLV